MDRLFPTHEIRRSREAGPLWTLTTPDDGGLSAPEPFLVPGTVEALPRLRNYRGRAVFEQEIECGGNVRLWFGGVSFRAKVWLDGALLAEHYGAYNGFETLATDVMPGRHALRVEADNRFGPDSALHVPNDYYSYGGITRPVLIERVADAWIAGLRVTPTLADGRWSAKVSVDVRGLRDVPQSLTLRLDVDGGEPAELPVAVPPMGTTTLTALVPCPDARPWSPDSPALSAVRATLLFEGEPVDDLIDRFGFREVRVDGGRLLLNGRPLALRGFNRHEDYAEFGCAVPVEAMMQDLRLMREMGCNFVRTCHYPNDPRFLDLCDALGMLVWEESHARGFDEQGMRHPAFMDQLRLSTREMVTQHFNHPSIILWACLNECADDTDFGAACYRETLALLRALDGSRPVTAALLARPGGKVYAECDVVSVNLYAQWYEGCTPHEAFARKQAEIDAGGGAGKPIIVSETGAGAIPGFHDPFGRAKWSEERQCDILRDQITDFLAEPRCVGLLLWQFADVRVDESWAMRRPRTRNNKGVVDEYRRPKLAFETVRELFSRE